MIHSVLAGIVCINSVNALLGMTVFTFLILMTRVVMAKMAPLDPSDQLDPVETLAPRVKMEHLVLLECV